LTVFFLHNLLFFIPSTFLPSEGLFFIFITFYSFLYVFLAIIWQKWHFQYSLEWGIMKILEYLHIK
jgi:hypothetical protein